MERSFALEVVRKGISSEVILFSRFSAETLGMSLRHLHHHLSPSFLMKCAVVCGKIVLLHLAENLHWFFHTNRKRPLSNGTFPFPFYS